MCSFHDMITALVQLFHTETHAHARINKYALYYHGDQYHVTNVTTIIVNRWWWPTFIRLPYNHLYSSHCRIMHACMASTWSVRAHVCVRVCELSLYGFSSGLMLKFNCANMHSDHPYNFDLYGFHNTRYHELMHSRIKVNLNWLYTIYPLLLYIMRAIL